MEKKETAKAIYKHLQEINKILEGIQNEKSLYFSACMIQDEKKGTYISFVASERSNAGNVFFDYDNILGFNTGESIETYYENEFVEENVK